MLGLNFVTQKLKSLIFYDGLFCHGGFFVGGIFLCGIFQPILLTLFF